MEMGSPQHKVSAGDADLGAIEEQPNVSWFSVLSSHLQTMGNRFGTNAMAVQAILDASAHLFIYLVYMCHFGFLVYTFLAFYLGLLCELLRVFIELLLATVRTKVVGLAAIVAFSRSRSSFHVHSANWIFMHAFVSLIKIDLRHYVGALKVKQVLLQFHRAYGGRVSLFTPRAAVWSRLKPALEMLTVAFGEL